LLFSDFKAQVIYVPLKNIKLMLSGNELGVKTKNELGWKKIFHSVDTNIVSITAKYVFSLYPAA